ncbi:hypothetical protein BN1096_630091 [Clostridioides difficile]|uniref:Uncharacterized protein n=1 Tax=Clostridioides difficile TaxID=1496 RepID=A0A069AI73_CLODI|nr:hypothetical protein BN1096_630091 [Clostridioides difficile]
MPQNIDNPVFIVKILKMHLILYKKECLINFLVHETLFLNKSYFN